MPQVDYTALDNPNLVLARFMDVYGMLDRLGFIMKRRGSRRFYQHIIPLGYPVDDRFSKCQITHVAFNSACLSYGYWPVPDQLNIEIKYGRPVLRHWLKPVSDFKRLADSDSVTIDTENDGQLLVFERRFMALVYALSIKRVCREAINRLGEHVELPGYKALSCAVLAGLDRPTVFSKASTEFWWEGPPLEPSLDFVKTVRRLAAKHHRRSAG